jgi:hypothetical protein
MVDMENLVARILDRRAVAPTSRNLLVGISGIHGSGKG